MTIPASMIAHLQETVTTTAHCMKVTRTDGTEFRYTDLDASLDVPGDGLYLGGKLMVNAVRSTTNFDPGGLAFSGKIDDDDITRADIVSGLWDEATFELFKVNYADLSEDIWPLRKGWLGEITVSGETFSVEARPLKSAYRRGIGRAITPGCMVRRLGDAECKIDLGPFTHSLIVTSVRSSEPNSRFSHTADIQDEHYFRYGTVTWTSGNNVGTEQEVRNYDDGPDPGRQFELLVDTPYVIEVGDEFDAIIGCDRRKDTCINVFDNLVNFRGFPDVPGLDSAIGTP